jgi:hypothetical protein
MEDFLSGEERLHAKLYLKKTRTFSNISLHQSKNVGCLASHKIF